MTAQITHPWNKPWSEAADVLANDTGYYPVSIDGREYVVDLTTQQYRRASVDVLRTRQNQTPNENLLLEPEVWRTAVESWHHGAGQTRYDRDASTPYRFFASKNIDPWDDWRLSLLNETDLLVSIPAEPVRLYATPQRLVLVTTTEVRTYTSLDAATESVISLPSTMWSTASDGQHIYVLCSNNTVYKVNPVTEAVTAKATLPASGDMVAYVKGFLIATAGPAVYDISSGVADSTTLIYTAPLDGHRWVDATDGLAAGYLLGGQGDKWHAYWITVRDDASTLNPPVVAAPLPEGEIGYSLGSYLGFVLIGTDRGVRFCTPAGDNTLTYGRLIVTDEPVVDFEGQDRFVWFGIGGSQRDLKEALRQPEAGLARLDLSQFTAPLTPAYAADLIARSSGVDNTGVGAYVTTFAGKRVFSVPGGAVYYETDTSAGEGWLEQGVMTMNVRDTKIGLYTHVQTEPLAGEVAVDLAYDSVDYNEVVRMTAQNLVSSGNVSLYGETWEALLPRYRLTAKADGSTPVLTRFEVRCVPQVGRADEWVVPVLIAQVLDWENVETGRNQADDLQHLVSLVQSGRTFTFREGTQTYDCYAAGYDFRPLNLTQGTMAFQGVCFIRLRSIR